MKKLLFMFIALLMSGAIMAQGSKGKMTTKSFLAFHGGPTFPVGDFASSNQYNEEAGFAKTGFNLNLNYAYQFNKNIGLTAAVLYNKYTINSKLLTHELPGAKVDHWQFYGITAGPMFTHEIAKKAAADIRIMGGVANANTPRFTYETEVLLKEDWQAAFVFQGGIDFRINTGGMVFILLNTDYTALKPEFKLIDADGIVVDRYRQNITVVNLTGGVGIKF